jgi:hypothetical protein
VDVQNASQGTQQGVADVESGVPISHGKTDGVHSGVAGLEG